MIANIDASIDQTLSKLKQGYQIDAFVWHQGESDYEHGKEYYQNLKGVVSYVRNHLTEKTGKDYSELPFIFGTYPGKTRGIIVMLRKECVAMQKKIRTLI